jgi:hypothetical protein
MMQNFWLLLLAHLVGDYAFQTNEIAKNKTKNLSGLLKHIYLIFVANIIVVMPRNFESWLGISIITFAHFLEDSQPFSKKKGNVWIFLLDQTIHVLTILVISYYFKFYNPILSPKLAYLASSFLLIVYFMDFVEFFMLKRKFYDRDIMKLSWGVLIFYFTFYYIVAVPVIIFLDFIIDKNEFKKNWVYLLLVTIVSCLMFILYKYLF